MRDIRFDSIRSDWYAANTLLPRLVVKAVLGKERLRFVGFPAQWIPVFVHYNIRYDKPRAPLSYLPLFSDLSTEQVTSLTLESKKRGASRSLAESAAALDAVISDFIYIVDHKLADKDHADPGTSGSNQLNTWHSFGRPEIIGLQQRMCEHSVHGDTFVMLPCARHRPYDESRTHARLLRQLSATNHSVAGVEEHFWRDPLVMTYDAGAVDLWRVFQLLRAFFRNNRPRAVIDCLSFKPYSDMLRVLAKLGDIKDVVRPLTLRWRGFQAKCP
jgi:hypothetical protein